MSKMSIVNKLLIWITVLLLQACSISAFLNCSRCSHGESLLCPNYTNHQFELKLMSHGYETNTYMEINCASTDEVDFSLLEGCSFPSVRLFKFMLCPLTNNSFKETFKQIGVRAENIEHITVYYPFKSIPSLRSDHFEGLTNLTYLNLDNTQFTNLPGDAFVLIPNLKTLYLTGNDWSTLANDTFRSLKNLVILNLSHNNISYIPDGLFDHLQKLESLIIWKNKVEKLPKNIFSNLTLLKNLTMIANKLSSLDFEMFRGNSLLENVNFKKNKIQSLPEDLFLNCTNLISAKFSDNKIESVPEKLFTSSAMLKVFEIDKNALQSIPDSILIRLESLFSIKLAKNRLKTLPINLFANNNKLESVDLSNNLINALPSDLFKSLVNLKVLNLNNNSLTSLPDNIFRYCLSLRELFINRNNLSVLSFNSFPVTKLPQLLKIDLSRNMLNTSGIINPEFALNTQISLEHIDFSYNEFDDYPSEAKFYNYLKLNYLSFEGNYIRAISLIDIFDLPNDCELNLRLNDLEKIYDYTKPERKQVNVYLEGNNFTCDCHVYALVKAVQNPTELKRFSYHTSNGGSDDLLLTAVMNVVDRESLLCHRPASFFNKPLTSIGLFELQCTMPSANCILDCSCLYRPFDKMIIVDCSNKHLTTMPNITSLLKPNYNYTFDMSGNNIALFNLTTYDLVASLSLVGNNMTMTNMKEYLLPPHLKFLDLRGNNFNFLSEDFTSEINSTGTRIDLTDNPWICDCNIKFLHNFIQAQYAKVENIRNLKCKDTGVPIVDLREEDLCPLLLQPMVLTTIGVVTALLVLFAVLGTVSFYRYKTRIKVWLFTHRMCLWLVTEDELDSNKQYDAFISYSHKDEEFVNNILVPGLENGDPKYRVCLHYRDWIVGEFIQNQIMNSVHNSRRTLVILSTNFIESIWGQMEFRAAHQQALQDKTNRVIVIIYGEMPPEESLDEELKHYIKLHTYLKWGSPRFWESLRYAMPHPKHLLARRKRKRKEFDKMELANGHTKQAIRV